jgi:hypothetical protein
MAGFFFAIRATDEPRSAETPGDPSHALRQVQGSADRRPAGPLLNWFARTGFPKGELGQLLALMQEIDHNGLKPLLDPLRDRS